MTELLTPEEPALTTADLPGSGGRLGSEPEDFGVDEVLPFAPSGEGDHFFVRIQKRDTTTPDAVRLISRAARVAERDIGVAGMKDKRAVTTQWLSLPAKAAPADSWELPDALKVLEVTRHSRKLRTGQQLGNHFRIRLVDVPEGGLGRALELCRAIQQRGLPNSFGEQRFGFGGNNLRHAVDWFRRGCPGQGPKTRFYRKLYPSVVQSEIFNRYLTLRRARGFERLLKGEVVRLDGSRAMFIVEDVDRELPRLQARDIHLTGPLPGPDMKPAQHEALELERAACDTLALGEEQQRLLADSAPGTRRDLLVWPGDLKVSEPVAGQLELEFFLPSGSFATQLVRELIRPKWLQARARAESESE